MDTRKPKTYFWDNASALNDDQFKSFFRVTKLVFNSVLETISASNIFLTPSNVGARAVTVDRQLGIFLLRAGAKTCSIIATLMDVSMSSVVTSTERVCMAIIECYPHAIHMAPQGPEKDMAMQSFANKGFPGATSIVDVCKIQVTVETQVARAGLRHTYTDRHHMVVQSYQFAVDADYRILDISGGQGGPMSDQTIFYKSALYQRMGSLLADKQYYMGDMGYALSPWASWQPQ
jgi:hypothetical protein